MPLSDVVLGALVAFLARQEGHGKGCCRGCSKTQSSSNGKRSP
jgi:hypothetical protein